MIILKTWALRMIKAVFFDWFYTLARFEPPRHQLYSQAFQEFGIELPPEKAMRGILIADQYFFEENAKSPVAERSPEEQLEVYINYPNAILTEAGAKAPRELPLKILKRVREQFKGITFALFDDVLSTLKTLKQQNFILGLLTNLDSDMAPICRGVGLEPYLDFVVTSKEAGADKPKPPIFLAALDKAGVNASEAVHVGDQYKLDVIGARAVGINPILVDRYDIYPEVSDCPRIHNLTELAQYL
ncbi:Phosphoglycolate phosphatase [subsurface metagenome]